MKKFIESFINVWKIEELKNRILITLGLLLVYRFGAHVTLPGIDATQLGGLTGQTEKGIGSIQVVMKKIILVVILVELV